MLQFDIFKRAVRTYAAHTEREYRAATISNVWQQKKKNRNRGNNKRNENGEKSLERSASEKRERMETAFYIERTYSHVCF